MSTRWKSCAQPSTTSDLSMTKQTAPSTKPLASVVATLQQAGRTVAVVSVTGTQVMASAGHGVGRDGNTQIAFATLV